MKHITMANRSLLIGDEATDLLTAYAALLARIPSGDAVTLRAIGIDGAQVEATFVLNSGTVLMVESSTSTLQEPDNAEGVAYLRERLDSYGPSSGFPAHNDADGER